VKRARRSAIAAALTLASLCGGAAAAQARPLDKLIPRLFGGEFATSITPRAAQDAQRPRVADRFRGLSASLAAARSQAPVPSASGAFTFAWDDDLETYVRATYNLGPSLAERAPTLGKGTYFAGVSYTRVDFDTLDGDSLNHIRSVQPALSEDFIAQLPSESDRERARDNMLESAIDLDFGLDLFFITFAYGLTDSIDLSASLAVNRAEMKARATAAITDPNGDEGAFFVVSQPGVVVGGSGPICSTDFRCASDSAKDSATGTGDIFLRAKWHAWHSAYADLGLVGVLTVPTGNADDFLGFHDPTFTPWLVASAAFGRFEPHLNVGYSIRSSEDVGQAQWIVGSGILLIERITLVGDFLGYHDEKRDGVNDDVLQSAVGLRLNPIGNLVLTATFQFPLNNDGLRANVIYTGQMEYTF
jgi:hypothetical protein